MLRKKKQGGFTLVEILIAMALVGVITLGAYGLLRSGLLAFRAGTDAYDAQSSTSAALLGITRAARQEPDFSPARYTLRGDALYDGDRLLASPVSDFSVVIEGGLVRVSVTLPDGRTASAAVRMAAQ